MNVLIYAHDFAPSVGGVETVVMMLARGLSRQPSERTGKAIQVTVVTQTAAGNFRDEELAFRVVRRPGVWGLWGLMRRADVVHLAGPAFLPLAMGLVVGKKVVVEHHGFQAICPNGQMFYEPSQTPCPGHFMAGRHLKCLQCNKRMGTTVSAKLWLSTFIRRWLARRANLQIAPTHWLASKLKMNGVRTIFHGVPEKAADCMLPCSTEPPHVVFLGRLVTTKGVGTLLEAVAGVRQCGRDLRVDVIGDGPERKSLEVRARELGMAKTVNFRGRLDEDQVDRLCAGALCVAMPSLGGEVFGLVAAEQMMKGRAMVVTEGEALAEVVGEAGLVFPAGDAVALKHRLEQLLDEQGLAVRLGTLGRQRAIDFFRVQRMIDGHFAAYQDVLGGGSSHC